jgi:rubredoxin
MAVEAEYGGIPWYECELCGLMLDDKDGAQQHEDNCDTEQADSYQ